MVRIARYCFGVLVGALVVGTVNAESQRYTVSVSPGESKLNQSLGGFIMLDPANAAAELSAVCASIDGVDAGSGRSYAVVTNGPLSHASASGYAYRCDWQKVDSAGNYVSGSGIAYLQGSAAYCPVPPATVELIRYAFRVRSLDAVVATDPVNDATPGGTGCYNHCEVGFSEFTDCWANTDPDADGLHPAWCNASYLYLGSTCDSAPYEPPETPTAPPDPGTGDPGTGDPGTGDPGTGDPGTGDPGTGDPGTGDPGTGDPGTGDPGTGDPGTGDPGTGDPGTGDPGTGDPGTGDPGTGDPGTGDDTGDDTGAVVGALDCDISLLCEGDPVACQSLEVAKAERCDDLARWALDGEAVAELPTLESDTTINQIVPLDDMLSGDHGWLGGMGCPSPRSVSALGTNIEFSYQPICTLAGWLSALVLVIAGMLAMRVVGEGL